ncbi:MAG: ABC transporter substrate-binding protein [Amaricoccus sp.]
MAGAPRTIEPGILAVGSALPDPPFELAGPVTRGFDIGWMQALSAEIGLEWRLVRFPGDDFNRIFDGLGTAWDCVASGVTITPAREKVAAFCAPYLTSGQALAVNVRRTPQVRGTADLAGLTLAVQEGNTSEPVADGLLARGQIGAVRRYPYHAIATMLDDLEGGRVGVVMKLAPVLRWLTRGHPVLKVVADGLTAERIAVATAPGNPGLHAAIDAAQRRLDRKGTFRRLEEQWLKP